MHIVLDFRVTCWQKGFIDRIPLKKKRWMPSNKGAIPTAMPIWGWGQASIAFAWDFTDWLFLPWIMV
jgi:hypothetical protein